MRGIGSFDDDDDDDDSTDDSTDDSSGGGSRAGRRTSVRPIGVSPALEKLKVKDAGGTVKVVEDWYHAYKWPPDDVAWLTISATPGIPTTPGKRGSFPEGYWSSRHLAIAALGEFVLANDSGVKWDGLKGLLDTFYPTPAKVVDELKELVELVEYRSGVMSEAMAQRQNIAAYWRGVLMFNKGSHPATCRLIGIARTVGQFQVMHYKRIYNRERPSQLSPSLLPPINPPGHASFPSGHATEAYLMARCLEEVMPDAAKKPPVTAPTATTAAPGPVYFYERLGSPLQHMARRIARNREVLGLHYRSDSEAGKALAAKTYGILKNCDIVTNLTTLAQAEWNHPP